MACLGRAMPCCRASNEGRSASLYVPFGVAICAVCQSDTARSVEFRSPYGFSVSVWSSVDEAFFCMFYLQNTVSTSARRHGLSSPGACPAYGHGRKTWACRPVVSRFLCKFASKLLTAAYHGRLMSVCLRAHGHRPAGCHSSRFRASAGRHRWRGEGRAESRRGGMHVADC